MVEGCTNEAVGSHALAHFSLKPIADKEGYITFYEALTDDTDRRSTMNIKEMVYPIYCDSHENLISQYEHDISSLTKLIKKNCKKHKKSYSN